ncbi:MAG: hypothetical protein ACRDO7_08690, partial [Nocardioidaceae bacterium]
MSTLETEARESTGPPTPSTDTRRPGRRGPSRSQGRLAAILLLPAVLAVFGIVIYPVLRTLF